MRYFPTPKRLMGRMLALFLLCAMLISGSAVLSACSGGGSGAETDAADTMNDTDGNSDSESETSEPLPPVQTESEPGVTEPPVEPQTLPAGDETDTPEPIFDPEAVQAEVMPRLDITTEGGKRIKSKDEYVSCTVTLSACGKRYAFADAPAGIRVRGNSTGDAPKKPYRLKFESKQAMLGLNHNKKFKSWCLMADYYDASGLRTYATFRMAGALLDGCVYSSDCAHVEVWINGSFEGVYLLCEQTQINEDRIDIPERAEGSRDVKTGYLMIGQGGRTDEPETIVIRPGITVRDRNGKKSTYNAMNFALSGSGWTDSQKNYCSTYVSAVFKVIASAVYDHEYYRLRRNGTTIPRTFPEGTTEEEKQIQTIDAVFNIDSAVALCVVDEIAKNLDAMTFNMYVDLSEDGDGRLTLAAPWDFDFSMANTHYDETHAASGWYATNLTPSEGVRVNLLYVLFGSVDWFEERMAALWREKLPVLRAIADEVLAEGLRYDDAFDRDFERWGMPAKRTLIHHHDTADLNAVTDHADTAYFVHDWLEARLRWLDDQWGDGSWARPAQDERLLIDFTDPASEKYLTGFSKRCRGTLTDEGLVLTLRDPLDPYFYVDLSCLGDTFRAEDYPIIEITYLIPKTNSKRNYECRVYLCTGNVTEARDGRSVTFDYAPTSSGRVHIKRLDLSDNRYWSGRINSIRIDFFEDCAAGDTMTILRVDFRTTASK